MEQKVTAITTKSKEGIFSPIIYRTVDNKYCFYQFYGSAWENMGDEYHQLYILSEDDKDTLENGDWGFRISDSTIFKVNENSDHKHYTCYKILGTTNPELIKDGILEVHDSFIQKFCHSEGDVRDIFIKQITQTFDNSADLMSPGSTAKFCQTTLKRPVLSEDGLLMVFNRDDEDENLKINDRANFLELVKDKILVVKIDSITKQQYEKAAMLRGLEGMMLDKDSHFSIYALENIDSVVEYIKNIE